MTADPLSSSGEWTGSQSHLRDFTPISTHRSSSESLLDHDNSSRPSVSAGNLSGSRRRQQFAFKPDNGTSSLSYNDISKFDSNDIQFTFNSHASHKRLDVPPNSTTNVTNTNTNTNTTTSTPTASTPTTLSNVPATTMQSPLVQKTMVDELLATLSSSKPVQNKPTTSTTTERGSSFFGSTSASTTSSSSGGPGGSSASTSANPVNNLINSHLSATSNFSFTTTSHSVHNLNDLRTQNVSMPNFVFPKGSLADTSLSHSNNNNNNHSSHHFPSAQNSAAQLNLHPLMPALSDPLQSTDSKVAKTRTFTEFSSVLGSQASGGNLSLTKLDNQPSLLTFNSVPVVTVEPNTKRRRTVEPKRQVAFQMETATTAAVSVPGHKEMEDRLKVVESLEMVSPEIGHVSFAGVYDGHGGSGAADFVQQHLWWELAVNPMFRKGQYAEALKECFRSVDEKFLAQARSTFDSSGACSLVMLGVRAPSVNPTLPAALLGADAKKMKIIVANCGDCRAILCPLEGDPIPLSRDHKVSDPQEKERLLQAGAFVTDSKLFGMLHVSRAIGDRDFKTPLKPGSLPALLSEPDIVEMELDVSVHSFVVLATDGVWDVLSNYEVQDLVRTHLNARKTTGHGLQSCAESIVDEAVKRGSRDDISVVIRLL